jgi:hypothetical protein
MRRKVHKVVVGMMLMVEEGTMKNLPLSSARKSEGGFLGWQKKSLMSNLRGSEEENLSTLSVFGLKDGS